MILMGKQPTQTIITEIQNNIGKIPLVAYMGLIMHLCVKPLVPRKTSAGGARKTRRRSHSHRRATRRHR
jgi:hypothetical protein